MMAKQGAPKASNNRNAMQQYATFYVGDMLMGIELSEVQELMRYQEMAPVPLAPFAIEGLINLRGQIVAALDVRKLFSLEPMKDDEAQPMNIVIHSEDGAVSLLVDEIYDVLNIAADAWTELPENLPTEHRRLLKGIYQLESRLLMVLDTERVLSLGPH